jgi:hypothetical protein
MTQDNHFKVESTMGPSGDTLHAKLCGEYVGIGTAPLSALRVLCNNKTQMPFPFDG